MRFPGLFLIMAGLSLPLAAHATLGGTVSNLQGSTKSVLATSRATSSSSSSSASSSASYSDHVTTLSTGVVVHEYTDSDGTVFAVTWHGPIKPNLRELLGSYFSAYLAAGENRTGAQRSLSQLHSSSSSLVIHAGGHRGAFGGRAYLPSLVPSDVTVEDLE